MDKQLKDHQQQPHPPNLITQATVDRDGCILATKPGIYVLTENVVLPNIQSHLTKELKDLSEKH